MIDGQTHIHTHEGNDNTRRPILASGKNDKSFQYYNFFQPDFKENFPLSRSVGTMI